jgi:hypothetical protein
MKGGLLGLPGLHAGNIAPDRLRPLLAEATTLQGLIDLGVERGFTIWPEWGPTFTHLDKGGQPAARTPGIENRPNPPPANLIGKRIAFHNGAHVGGRPGSGAFDEGVRAVLATARSADWEVSSFMHPRGGVFYEMRKNGTMISWDPSWNPLAGGTPIGTVSTIGIPRSAITFTAVIAGFEPPTDSPKYPWQHASDPEDSEDWSYGWHVTDVVVLRTPIPCAGLQGPWTLAGAIAREAKQKAKAAR